MKISDIKKGTEYGLRQRRIDDPRRVEVLGIATVVEQVWDHALERYKPRNMRRVTVKFLDKAPDRWAAAKGSKEEVSPNLIVAPWSELGPNLQKRAAEAEARDKMQTDLSKRMKKLLGSNYDGYVMVNSTDRPMLDVNGKSFLKLLDLAEAGTRMKK